MFSANRRGIQSRLSSSAENDQQKKQAKLIGRIIFADLLELPLRKYKNFIEAVRNSLLLDKLPIKVERLSRTRISDKAKEGSSKVVAEIARTGRGFSIRYTYEGFNIRYLVDTKKFLDCPALMHKCGIDASITQKRYSTTEEARRLVHKLRRISSRNEITHEILKGVIKHQECYLRSGNPLDLIPLSQVQLSNWLNSSSTNGNYIDNSVISRIISGKSIITPLGDEILLRHLFPTQKEINKRLIKEFLDKEAQHFEFSEIKRPASDRQIRDNLRRVYHLDISRHSIGTCRQELGIPASSRRIYGYKYPPLSANFSLFYSLEVESVNNNAPCSSGAYELRLNSAEIKYPIGSTSVIYLGSGKNIRKRLKDHLRPGSKNGAMKEFLKKHKCLFRYILLLKKWKEEEKRLYDLFVSTYGSPPKCNRVHP
ncbi:MAG: hypothetical protein U9O41_03665 [Candidatus Aerophobetes bacterium]|nr:hypothetical protein [Candidatus Aerophobetes bacterium]